MTDDQGYGDIGFHGNPLIRTPVMDSLARIGTCIDPFYVSPVCAPTRSSLMTGRFHLRTGVYDTYNGGAMMSSEETTIAEVLSSHGYQTGMIGKWHLGDNYPMRPQDQGFQYTLMHRGGGIGQPGDDYGNFTRGDSAYFDPFLWENGRRIRKYGYCSDIFTDQAIDFIRQHNQTQEKNPFFLYLAYNAPHTPLQLPEKYLAEYRRLQMSEEDFEISGENLASMSAADLEDARRVYGMVSNIDDNLGKIWNVLRELNLEEQTLVVFLTDNGPQQRRYTAGLRQRKGSVMEGGIRVPCIWVWKGKIAANREITYPSAHIDVMPTLLEFAGIDFHGEMDGRSLYNALMHGNGDPSVRPLFFVWERGFPQKYSNIAVRKGDYKLVGQFSYDQPDSLLQLYHIRKDPYEQDNLRNLNLQITADLKEELDSWYEEVIHSPHLVVSPRIILGSPHENPVILGRNDWKGPRAMQWNAQDAFGYWDIQVVDPGPYSITLVFKDPLPPGKAVFRSGSSQYWINEQQTGIQEIVFSDVYLHTGLQMFEAWFQQGGSIFAPFYISAEKTTNPEKNDYIQP
jgi:arylsulfatase